VGKEYIELDSVVNFEGFDYNECYVNEVLLLEPQLKELGYTYVLWMGGLGGDRTCMAKKDEDLYWFIYHLPQ
jgi:hypothetical protein